MKLNEINIQNKGKIQAEEEIQSSENEKKRGHALSFLAGCFVGKDLYFSSWIDKGFYKMDIQTGICTFLKIFAEERESIQLFERAIYYKNAIWMTPAVCGEHIVKIDLDRLKMTYFDLPQNGKVIYGNNGVRYTKFKCCYKENASEFWLIPVGFNIFLRVDMESELVEEVHGWGKYVEFRDGATNFSDACFVGDEIWICPLESDKLIIFDTIKSDFRFLEWKNRGRDYRIIRNYENWAVFLPLGAKKNILMIEKDIYEEKKISVDIPWEEESSFMHLAVHTIDHFILLAPFLAHEFLAVDMETEEIQINKSLHEYAESMSWGPERYQTGIQYGSNVIYLSDMPGVPLMVYDWEKNTVIYVEKNLEQESYHKFLVELYKDDQLGFIEQWKLHEGIFFDETDFPSTLYFQILRELKDEEKKENDYGKTRNNIGEAILSKVK